jgi:4-hydroxyphenylpyruvate dioxygenase-like putative hemolysin
VKLDHLTAIVGDADAAAAALTRLLGAEHVGSVELGNMRIRTLRIGDVELHVNAPTGDGPVQNHFSRHGASLHHLAFSVEDLDATLSLLNNRGFKTLGAPVQPAPGFREVFIDPASTGGVLIQLVQRDHNVAPENLEGKAVDALAEHAESRGGRNFGRVGVLANDIAPDPDGCRDS